MLLLSILDWEFLHNSSLYQLVQALRGPEGPFGALECSALRVEALHYTTLDPLKTEQTNEPCLPCFLLGFFPVGFFSPSDFFFFKLSIKV